MANNLTPYYIGLNVSAKAVGWVLTDKSYQVIRANGRDQWGVQRFQRADTALECRQNRIARRTLGRKKKRLNFLNQCFADAINAVDPVFFTRLEESNFQIDERSSNNKQKNSLFNDLNYLDCDFKSQYPTIFHLKKELLESQKPHDVRLVYLALHNYYLHRGHFYNDTMGLDVASVDFDESYRELMEAAAVFEIKLPVVNGDDLKNILCDTTKNNTNKKKALEELLVAGKNQPIKQIIALMLGNKGNLIKLFGNYIDADTLETTSISFAEITDDAYDALASEISDDKMVLLSIIKDIYNGSLIEEMLDGEEYLANAYVKTYENHKADLAMLKKVIRKYGTEKMYSRIFKEYHAENYSGYIKHTYYKGKKIARHDENNKKNSGDWSLFAKNIKKTLEGLGDTALEDPDVQLLLAKIEDKTFMPKQRTSANAIIPNQILAREVAKILENAATYLPFLNEIDPKSNLTIKQELLSVMTFVRPFYVGSLANSSDDTRNWAHYRDGQSGSIMPWNLEKKVDCQKARKDFIHNIVGQCSYYPDKKVLPRHSLMYDKYAVLNELNGLHINGSRLSVEAKQSVFETLYKQGRPVTAAKIKNHLVKNGFYTKEAANTLSGFSGKNPICYLNSYGALLPIVGKEFLDNVEYQEVLEDIIFHATVFNDRQFLKKHIEDYYGNLFTDEQIAKLSKFTSMGWGNLSKEFLQTRGKKTGSNGAELSIMDALWLRQDNLMELLSINYTYKKNINAEQNHELLDLNNITAIINAYDVPPALKRMINQAMLQVRNAEKRMGYPPEHIFVAMSKDDDLLPRNNNKKKVLTKLYKGIKDYSVISKAEVAQLKKELDDVTEEDLREINLYLYFLQMGRCLYTGKKINRDFEGFNRDHIIPKAKSFSVDNSPERNLVLSDSTFNSDKDAKYPLSLIGGLQEQQMPLWISLHTNGFISNEKLSRLIRKTEITEDEYIQMLDNELSDTNYVAKVLKDLIRRTHKRKVDVFVKAKHIARFRQMYDLPKVKLLNDSYYGYDAYLATVVGNLFYNKYAKDIKSFICRSLNRQHSFNMDKIYDMDQYDDEGSLIWKCGEDGTIATCRKYYQRGTMLITFHKTIASGTLFDGTVYPKEIASKGKNYLTLKPSDPRYSLEKYGGKRSIKNAYAIFVEFESKKGLERRFIPVPMMKNINPNDTDRLIKHTQEYLGNELVDESSLQLLRTKICTNQKVKINGFTYRLAGSSDGLYSFVSDVPLYLNNDLTRYVKKIENIKEKGYSELDSNGDLVLTNAKNIDLYDALLDKFENTIFAKRKSVIPLLMRENRDMFVHANLQAQCEFLRNVLLWNNGTYATVDARLIEGSEHSGKIAFGKNFAADGMEVEFI